MLTIDGVEYSEEDLSEDGKIRAQRIMMLREQRVNLILQQQELDQSIMFHAQQIKAEMEPEEAQVIEEE
jgi:hypothetical protein